MFAFGLRIIVTVETHTSTLVSDGEVAEVLDKLVSYCRANNWSGYDPYDALNSPLFRTIPFLNRRIPRIVITQVLKRSPINVRELLRIPKTQNAKAIALFVSAFVALERQQAPCRTADVGAMIDTLYQLRSSHSSHWCWGYCFPWQTRTSVVPAGTPNVVCTSFVANALLDVFEYTEDRHCLAAAVSAADYIATELYWAANGVAGFAYPLPSIHGTVHNANLLGAALLARIYRYTTEERFLVPALQVARYSAAKQHADGSWYYGEALSQRWIDNFHTGYNLCALDSISHNASTTEFDLILRRGLAFYRSHFFRDDGAVRYFHNRTHPVDIHCVAQSIITAITFAEVDSGNLALAQSVCRWALTHLWDDRGFFYYRALRWYTNRMSYMRWSQAWMVVALVTLLTYLKRNGRAHLDADARSLRGVTND